MLYGSLVRGESTPESDIDLLVLLDDFSGPSEAIRELVEVLHPICLRFDVLISAVPVKQREFDSKTYNPFFRNVRREGVVVA